MELYDQTESLIVERLILDINLNLQPTSEFVGKIYRLDDSIGYFERLTIIIRLRTAQLVILGHFIDRIDRAIDCLKIQAFEKECVIGAEST